MRGLVASQIAAASLGLAAASVGGPSHSVPDKCDKASPGAQVTLAFDGAYIEGHCVKTGTYLVPAAETPLRHRLGRVPHRFDRIAPRDAR